MRPLIPLFVILCMLPLVDKSSFSCTNLSCTSSFKTRTALNHHRRYCTHEEPPAIVNISQKYKERKARKQKRQVKPRPELDIENPDIEMRSPSPPPPLDLPVEEAPAPPPDIEPEPELLGRSHRKKRLTWKALQNLPDPSPPPPVVKATSAINQNADQVSDAAPSFIWKAIRTIKSPFGLFREYPDIPSHNPDQYLTFKDITDKPLTSKSVSVRPPNLPPQLLPKLPKTLALPTVSGILQWMWTGSSTKSVAEVGRLISFLKSDAFRKEDLENFDIERETSTLDSFLQPSSSTPSKSPPKNIVTAPSSSSKQLIEANVNGPSRTNEPVLLVPAPSPNSSSSTPSQAYPIDPPTNGTVPMVSDPPPHTSTGSSQQVDLKPEDGWRKVTLDIQVPDGKTHDSPEENPIFRIPGLHLRSLVEVIKSVFSDPRSLSFHYTPFKAFWSPPTTLTPDEAVPEERIYDEIFSSDAMAEAHEEIHKLPVEPSIHGDIERVVAAMMFWSDSTHLANFGNASLWPIYMFFGNQSKYSRVKPSSATCQHVAYIPKLPDSFNDWFQLQAGKAPDSDLLAHCRRELMHQVWRLLLDDEFIHAYTHGIVIKCPDGNYRRFFPRIFTYSADYPEKVLLATIRNMGNCPCPRCLIPKEKIDEMGTVNDGKRRLRDERNSSWEHDKAKTARTWIYTDGSGIKCAAVERCLQPKSLVPTVNAFDRLTSLFSIYKALVVDFMHEIELGVWKALFTHLVRILHSMGTTVVQELNRRYRLIPAFGSSTIRRFSEDAAGMKKMAARNFEDLLQCAIPVFEGLLPEPHNKEVISLLYTMAEWHALAKLRLHTSSSLGLLREATSDLGRQLRRFRSFTCRSFITKELPSETAKRQRKAARKKANGTNGTATTQKPRKTDDNKYFNLSTYKFHALGDYVSTIAWLGATDSYSTQIGELEHKRAKKYYGRTNKRNATEQMTRLERRETFLSKLPPLPSAPKKVRARPKRKSHKAKDRGQDNDPSSLRAHYKISDSQNDKVQLTRFVGDNLDDPAVNDFLPKLKKHLLWRITHPGFTSPASFVDYLPSEYNRVNIIQDRVFEHKILQINYTTYDLRRAQDFLSASNHANVMCLSRDESSEHPFEYAQILKIFHVAVTHEVPGGTVIPQVFDVLFVRRYRVDLSYRAGFKRKRLPRLQFLPQVDAEAFDFVDPDNVIRGVHLLPAFATGTTDNLLQGNSLARAPGQNHDWLYLYVNIFADRDMYMRFRGGGVGHFRLPLPIEDEEYDHPPDDPMSELEEATMEEPSSVQDEEEDAEEEEGEDEEEDEDDEDEEGEGEESEADGYDTDTGDDNGGDNSHMEEDVF